jgi:hypothetical protein
MVSGILCYIRKEVLLDEMAVAMPWTELMTMIKAGHPSFDLNLMVRIHCMQQWFFKLSFGHNSRLRKLKSLSTTKICYRGLQLFNKIDGPNSRA